MIQMWKTWRCEKYENESGGTRPKRRQTTANLKIWQFENWKMMQQKTTNLPALADRKS